MLKKLLLLATALLSVDAGAAGLIRNKDISASAAIAYSKLNLTDSIVNADINSSAGIANSKLASMLTEHFKCRTSATTGTPEDCNATQSAAIVGKAPQLWRLQDASPSAPAAGSVHVYAYSDGNLYKKDSTGAVVQIQTGSSAGSTGGFAVLSGGNSSATYGSLNCRIFTATGSANLSVTQAGPVRFLLVGGGGAGGFGGGGGGGVIDHLAEDVWLQVGTYPVVVGQGGLAVASTNTRGSNGYDTTFAGFTAKGGGAGGAYRGPNDGLGSGATGGSGGGGGFNNCDSSCSSGSGGSGTAAKPEDQGKAGAAAAGVSGGCFTSSGGGGAGAIGGTGSACTGGTGGAGLASYISGTAVLYGGGGGGGGGNSGGSCAGSNASGGSGGGGQGGGTSAGSQGTDNLGGGGGGGCSANSSFGGRGGHGIAIICARAAGS